MLKSVPRNSKKDELSCDPLWTNYATHRTSLKGAEYATDTTTILKLMV